MTGYERGLHEVGDGAWAWLQPDGGWGWSNAGLVVDGDEALLVDTLFDLALTADMLDGMRKATPAAERIDTLVNTHANGDHCYGNQLVSGARIVASTRSAAEMDEVPPALLAGFLAAAPDLGAAGSFLARVFAPFSFDGIEATPPTATFDGRLDLRVGDREVSLIELGPAHTAGDVVVHVPDAGIVFTGDLVFHGGHPIVWAGPVANWVAACDRILELDPVTVVPGHGPLGDAGAVRDQRGYFEWLIGEGTPRFESGMAPMDAALELADGPYAGWGEGERLVANLVALWRDLGGAPPDDVVSVFAAMQTLSERPSR